MNYLALARKAGLIELGEENTAPPSARQGRLVLLAGCSDYARRRAEGFLRGDIPSSVPFTKEEISRRRAGRAVYGGLYGQRLELSFAGHSLRRARLRGTVEVGEGQARLEQRRREAKAPWRSQVRKKEEEV
jgi:hypothetical protein